MAPIVGQTITDKTIRVDGTHFVDCTFVRCRFVHGGGKFTWTRVKFTDCEFLFDGDAVYTLDMLYIMGRLGDEFMKEYVKLPTEH